MGNPQRVSDAGSFGHMVDVSRNEDKARYALDDVRADGTRKVKPFCPFIRQWIQKHPDYAPLVAPASTEKD